MKKKLLSFLTAMLILTMLLPEAALAGLARGSSGEEVISLQTMLFDMGYLFETPDGQFGSRTEAAVMEYQKAAGLKETGAVTNDLMTRINQDWQDHQKWIHEQLALDAAYEPFCCIQENGDGQSIFAYCERHARLWDATCSILMGGDAESALYSYYEWQAEVISLYNEWIDKVPEPVQSQLETNKSLCIQLMEAQLNAMRMSYEANDAEIDPTDVYYSAEIWMRSHCAWICWTLGTLQSK